MIRFACALLLLSTPALADPPRPTARAGVDVGTAYIFRGIPQEDQGVITQPSFELVVPIFAKTGAITNLEVGLGGWASMHTGPTGHPAAMTGPRPWYEADGTARATVTLRNTIGVTAAYTAYTSPNASFQTVHEASIGVGWNDRGDGRWLGFAPTIVVARELAGTASGPMSGTYLGVTSRPAIAIASTSGTSVELGFPLELDMSLGDYYDDDSGDDTIGAVAGGVSLAASLKFMPARFGSWSVSATARAFHFGPRMAAKLGDASAITMTGGAVVNF